MAQVGGAGTDLSRTEPLVRITRPAGGDHLGGEDTDFRRVGGEGGGAALRGGPRAGGAVPPLKGLHGLHQQASWPSPVGGHPDAVQVHGVMHLRYAPKSRVPLP
eukprot:5706727-Pyramimonas_sp.AAC.1